MSDPAQEAAEQLRTIRALMEKATLYRALSAPAAVAAGLLTLAVCGVLAFAAPTLSPHAFTLVWLAVLAVVMAVNLRLLRNSGPDRGEPLLSSGMRMTLRAVTPPLTAGFFLGALTAATRQSGYVDIAAFWILFYGLGLLAMGSFAPRSMIRLGKAFLLLGIIAFLPPVREVHALQYPLALTYMAVSFGALHVAYGVALLYVRPRPVSFNASSARPPSLSEDP